MSAEISINLPKNWIAGIYTVELQRPQASDWSQGTAEIVAETSFVVCGHSKWVSHCIKTAQDYIHNADNETLHVQEAMKTCKQKSTSNVLVLVNSNTHRAYERMHSCDSSKYTGPYRYNEWVKCGYSKINVFCT